MRCMNPHVATDIDRFLHFFVALLLAAYLNGKCEHSHSNSPQFMKKSRDVIHSCRRSAGQLPRAHSSISSPLLAVSSLTPPPMLGPRTRSAAQRAPRAEQPEVQHNGNGNGNDDEREPKRTKRGERTHAQAPASEQAAEAVAAANLYAFIMRKHSCVYFLRNYLTIQYSEAQKYIHHSRMLGPNR
jgi:hypothetical protein